MSFLNMEVDTGVGKYLRVKGGDTVDLHVLSESPLQISVHGFGKDRVSCMGEGCSMCLEGATPKIRWVVNVFDRKDKVVKIFEFGPSIARQIKAIAEMLNESQQTVHHIDLRIKAEGSGMDTDYTVLHRPMAGPIPEGLKLYNLP